MDDKPFNIVYELQGWRDKKGRFAKLERKFQDEQADLANDTMKQAVKLASKMSPVGERFKNIGPHRRQESAAPRISESWEGAFNETKDGGEAVLTNAAPHFVFYWKGTKPHDNIDPTGPWPLAWQGPAGVFHFAKHVNHPGTEPHPIVEDVVEALRPLALQKLGRVAVRVSEFLEEIFKGGNT